MAERGIEGIFAPVATLFDSDGDLDLAKYRGNMEWYCQSPLDGVVIMGSNGEYTLLDEDEKVRLIAAGVEAIGGRKVVMAGTGVESTRGTIALTKAVLPAMLARRRGHLAVVSSVMGYVGTPGRSTYSASKHALHGYFDSLRSGRVAKAGVSPCDRPARCGFIATSSMARKPSSASGTTRW